MKNSGEIQIAARYVSALFDVAKEASAIAAVERDLKSLASAAQKDSGFVDFLGSPLLGAAQQAQVMGAIADSFKAHPITKAFLVALAKAKRLSLLIEVARQFARKSEEARGEMSAEIITAQALTKEEIAQVADKLGKAYGKTVKLTGSQDKSLLGGAVVKIGSVQLDASLAGKLLRLEQTLKAA